MPLDAKNVGFHYERCKWIFRHIDLTLKAGEVVGLVGPSGSGKTTLARILAGYDMPLEGTVTLDGAPFPKTGYHPVQLVYQHPEKAVNPKWKMKDVLHEAGPIEPALLETLGIQKEWLCRWPNELSGGELQRFCVARALGTNTRYLIADEMTTMLDAITQAQIWNGLIDIAKKRSVGILVISHETALLNRLCERFIYLKKNQLIL